MTTKELIESLKSCGFTVSEDEDMIHAKKGKQTVNCDKTIQPDSLWTYVLSLLTEYNQTPLDERKPEPKFRVRFPEMNSDNGPQYLSTRARPLKGKFFVCALNPYLIQEFTRDEINQIINLPRFKGNFMDQLMINNVEEVKNND